MPVKVYDKLGQREVDVSPAEAQAGLERGDFDLLQGEVRVVQGNRTSTVRADQLADAAAHGWSLTDDEGAAEATLRREESTIGAQALAAAESAGAGASLGLSTYAEMLLGVDPERMAARREALGGAANVAELTGAIAPTIATLGASAPAQAGAQAGRGLAATVLRNTPTALVSRGALRFERGLASMAGETGAVAKILPKVGGGFVEGAAQGAGASIDDQVLGNHELAADQIAADGLMGGLFGAGAPIAVKGLASVMSGAARAPVAGMRVVLGRGNAASGGLASQEVSELVAMGADAPLSPAARAWKATAVANGAPDDVAHRLAVLADAENGPGEISRIARETPRIQREAAELLTDRVPKIHADMDEARRLANGESKARYWERLGPKDSRELHLRDGNAQLVERRRVGVDETDNLLRSHKGELAKLAEENQYALREFGGGQPYNSTILYQARNAMATFERELVEAHQLSGREVSTKAAMAADRYKRELGQIIEDNGGWGAARHVDPDVRVANHEIRKRYAEVRAHLERRDLWGAAADAQADINAAYVRYADADAAYKDATAGTGLGSVVNPDGSFNGFKAIKLVRAHGRTGGDVAVARLMDAMDARIAYFDKVAKYVDMDDAGKSAIASVKSNVEDLRREFKRQAKDAALADDLQTLRRAEGNDSPSHQLLTTVGPAVGGAVGSVFGPLGAALGTMAGVATQPHRSLLAYATIHGLLSKADKRLGGAVSKMLGKAGGLPMPMIPRLPLGAAAGAMAVRSREESHKRREMAVAKAVDYLGSSEALVQALAVPLYDVGRESPAVASMIQGNVQRAASFLQSKAPKVYKNGNRTLVDPVSAASFERYLEAVTDPIGALERFDASRLTKETVEAIQVVYPALYADLQRRIVDELAQAHADGREIPYDRRVRLGSAFNVPTDPSLIPQTGVTIQDLIGAQFDEPDAAAQMAAGRKPPGKIEGASKGTQTAADRTEMWRARA